MKLLITGDLVINQLYDSNLVDDEITALFSSSDYNITNLEAPITQSNSKILKTGPHIKGNEDSTLKILQKLKINAVTLANNHVLDYDEKGVKDTLAFCKKHQIETVGAGADLEIAKKTLFVELEGKKIGIVNFAENEWSSATPSSAGANPLDLIDNVKKIREAKTVSDFVLVIVHGGHEYYNLPSPRMQKQYRFYAEEGADAVVGHHTHCISGHEVYQGVPIYYSLGNFLFTKNNSFEDWYIGLVLEIELKNDKLNCKLYPTKQTKISFDLSLLHDDERNEVMRRLDKYNEIIADSKKLNVEWNNFIESKYESYIRYWSPTTFIQNQYLKSLFNKMGINFMNKTGLKLLLNLMRCESHADLSKEVTKNYLKK